MAEYVKEARGAQERDTLGLLAGVFFAAVGLTYLIGGNDVVSDNWGLILPAVLVVIGAAGLLSSGAVKAAVRRSAGADAFPAASTVADAPTRAEATAEPESPADPYQEPET